MSDCLITYLICAIYFVSKYKIWCKKPSTDCITQITFYSFPHVAAGKKLKSQNIRHTYTRYAVRCGRKLLQFCRPTHNIPMAALPEIHLRRRYTSQQVCRVRPLVFSIMMEILACDPQHKSKTPTPAL